MKIVYNETQTTVILNGGRLELLPKGSPDGRDHRQIADSIAELPDVKRFAQLGMIRVLTLEEAAANVPSTSPAVEPSVVKPTKEAPATKVDEAPAESEVISAEETPPKEEERSRRRRRH